MFLSLKGSLNTKFPRFKGILDSYAGASAAYSLRRLSKVASSVVRVRRSSDNDEKDFTANQIESGEMVNWVNTDVLIYESDFSSGTDGFVTTASPSLDGNIDSIGGLNDNLRLTVNSPLVTVNTYFRRNSILSVGNSHRVTFDAYIPSTNSVLDDFDTVAFGTSQVNVEGQITLDQWTSYDVTGTANNTALFIRLKGNSSGDATGDVVYIRNVQITQTTADGFVETWYDQSGNGNDATQSVATAQPKIVDGGSLVADGIDFDNVNDFLESVNTETFGTSARSIFAVCAPNSITANADGIVQLSKSTAQGEGWLITPEVAIRTNTRTWISSTPAILSQNNLISNIYTSGLLHDGNAIWLNGASVARTSGTNGTIDTVTSEIRIGSGNSDVLAFDGAISEIIIYKSDQSANRAAIEDNINAHYNIYP